jgi:protein phosphatase
MAREDPGLAGMGTTVVALLLDAAGRAAVAHVGDSRCYRWRGRRLAPLTTDHSVVAEMQRRGVLTAEEAAYHPRRNEILRSVGVLAEVEVELAAVEIAAGDWYLLCSDGLCGVVSDAEIEEVLASETSPDAAARALVALANECGGPDNVTVQILGIPDAWPAVRDEARPTHAPARSIGGLDGDERSADTAGRAGMAASGGTGRGLASRVAALGDSPAAAWIVIALFSLVAYALWRLLLK